MNNPRKSRQGPPKGMPKKSLPKYNQSPFSWLIIALIIMTMLMMLRGVQKVEEINYSPDFLEYVEAGYIESVKIQDNKIEGKFNESGIASRKEKAPVKFEVIYLDSMWDPTLIPGLRNSGIEVKGELPDMWLSVLLQLLPIFILIAICNLLQ